MSVLIPKEINYANGHPALPPNVTNIKMVLAPTQSGAIVQGSVVQFDLPAANFADPGSFYVRLKPTFITTAATSWICTPAVAPIFKLEVIVGSVPYQTITNYNMVYNMVTNLQMNVAQKVGAVNLGYLDNVTVPTFVNMNGGTIPNGANAVSYSFPLMSVLSSAENLIPLFLMPGVRIQMTIANIADIVANPANVTSMVLNNFELCYDSINFGAEIENTVRSMGDVLYIKSHGWSVTSQTLGITQGNNNLLFNTRYQSIRSLFGSFSGNNARCVNKNFDSVDITSGAGDYQFSVNGVGYPTRPINTATNKYGAIMELKQAINGGLHTLQAQNMSLNQSEYAAVDASTTSVAVPGKFWLGVNTEKLSTSNALLTGISSKDMPISLIMNLSTPTTQPYNMSLIILYDALIKIEVQNRSASIII